MKGVSYRLNLLLLFCSVTPQYRYSRREMYLKYPYRCPKQQPYKFTTSLPALRRAGTLS